MIADKHTQTDRHTRYNTPVPYRGRSKNNNKITQPGRRTGVSNCLTSYRLGAARRYAPNPPMAVRLAADLRPSADGSAVRTSLVAGQLQAASVPIAQAAAPRSQRRLGQTDGRIAVSLKAHIQRRNLGWTGWAKSRQGPTSSRQKIKK